MIETDKGALERRYIFPPFSVINANSGAWRQRKDKWLSIGLDSSAGRESDMIFSAVRNNQNMALKSAKEKELGFPITWEKFSELFPDAKTSEGTSIFDPNLVDILVNWFCPLGGVVADPFAGGSVRGAVTVALGRRYVGTDLSAKQITENERQWNDVIAGKVSGGGRPSWHNDDGHNLGKYIEKADFVLSCPPYHDLEVYSSEPGDISNMDYADFLDAYRRIIAGTVEIMNEDSFAAFVVGEIRHGKTGVYRNFVGDTVKAFTDAGADYYNEMILYTAIGSLPIRVGVMFESSRKIGKTHQNILIFCKGDPRNAAAKCVGGVVDAFAGTMVPALDDLFV